MVIEKYSFGRIRIDGKVFAKDVVILRGQVVSPWWRKAGGHVFAPEDLVEVIAAAPEVVLLGTGYLGVARVREDTLEAFQAAGTRVICNRTGPIVEQFNRLSGEGSDLAAALHLSC